jgi:hypothetical protein
VIAGVLVAALLWVTVLARLPSLRRGVRQRIFWANLLCCALAVTVALPALATGRPVPVVAHVFALAAAQMLLSFVCLVTGTGRPWVQWSLTGAMMAYLVVRARHGTPADPFLTQGATEVAYWSAFHGYLAFLMLLNARACTIIGRAAPAGHVRRGILAMGHGILVIALYALAKALLIGAVNAGPGADLRAWEPWLVAVRTGGVLLYLIGGAVPAVVRLRPVLDVYRSLLVLRPLWSAMRHAFPQVVLMPPAAAALRMPGVAGSRLRLYRRVIEIRDGLLALRPYLPAECPEQARTAAGRKPEQAQPAAGRKPEQAGPEQEEEAALEAERIVAALRQRSTGRPPDGAPGRWAVVGPEMADEVAWLSAVSRHFKSLSGAGLNRPGARTPRPSGSPR